MTSRSNDRACAVFRTTLCAGVRLSAGCRNALVSHFKPPMMRMNVRNYLGDLRPGTYDDRECDHAALVKWLGRS